MEKRDLALFPWGKKMHLVYGLQKNVGKMDNWYALLGSLPDILVEGKVRATAPAIVGWLVFFGRGAFLGPILFLWFWRCPGH